jgi:hypothetical protein
LKGVFAERITSLEKLGHKVLFEKESQAFFWHEKFGQALLNYYLVFGILLVIVTSVLQNCNSRYNNFTHKIYKLLGTKKCLVANPIFESGVNLPIFI